MAKNKNHWYDGWFYDTIIAPNQDKLFGQIKDLVPLQSTIIDIGCGTGRLEFFLAGRCKSLLGIDLSKRNIDRAKQTLLKFPDERISFHHGNIGEVINAGNIKFDYAILTYVIHEVNEDERINLLKEISLIANKIIIGDYLVPRPDGIGGFMSETIEFIAGREHYRNYKSYVANGGLDYLAHKAGLRIIKKHISDHQLINHIVVLEK
jgi:SAM-dependent methyltransferase